MGEMAVSEASFRGTAFSTSRWHPEAACRPGAQGAPLGEHNETRGGLSKWESLLIDLERHAYPKSILASRRNMRTSRRRFADYSPVTLRYSA